VVVKHSHNRRDTEGSTARRSAAIFTCGDINVSVLSFRDVSCDFADRDMVVAQATIHESTRNFTNALFSLSAPSTLRRENKKFDVCFGEDRSEQISSVCLSTNICGLCA
jgi:hypothetical protein